MYFIAVHKKQIPETVSIDAHDAGRIAGNGPTSPVILHLSGPALRTVSSRSSQPRHRKGDVKILDVSSQWILFNLLSPIVSLVF